MEKFDSAYPCHIYLLRSVKNDDEFQIFAVNYVNSILSSKSVILFIWIAGFLF